MDELAHAFLFIADDAVHVRQMIVAVDRNDRDRFRDLLQLPYILFRRKGRADRDDGIDVLGRHIRDVLAVAAPVLARIGQHDVQVVAAQALFQQRHGAGIKNIGYICTNYADDFHGIKAQAAGKGIGLVPHVLHDFQNAGPGLFADAAAAVEHPRYCSDRHAALLGNIVNRYIHERIIPLVLLVKSRRRSLCRGALPYYSIKMAMG